MKISLAELDVCYRLDSRVGSIDCDGTLRKAPGSFVPDFAFQGRGCPAMQTLQGVRVGLSQVHAFSWSRRHDRAAISSGIEVEVTDVAEQVIEGFGGAFTESSGLVFRPPTSLKQLELQTADFTSEFTGS